jgi:hypothetical protein
VKFTVVVFRVGDVDYRIAIEAEIESMEGYEISLEGSALSTATSVRPF